jgi:hypothetical protein
MAQLPECSCGLSLIHFGEQNRLYRLLSMMLIANRYHFAEHAPDVPDLVVLHIKLKAGSVECRR